MERSHVWGYHTDGVIKYNAAEEVPVTVRGSGSRHHDWHTSSCAFDKQDQSSSCYLGADYLLRKVGHGVSEPALQTFGKVPYGLSESA